MRLLLILLFPALLFSQDFRKMSFGQTTEELKETYPEVDFTIEEQDGMVILSQDDFVGGIKTTVAYLFLDNSLMSGFYFFDDENYYKSSDDRYKDYVNISGYLNNKYKMKENNTWHNDSYKNDPNRYSHAFAMGYVDFYESYENDRVFIRHTVEKSDGAITHILGYSNPQFAAQMQAENESDF